MMSSTVPCNFDPAVEALECWGVVRDVAAPIKVELPPWDGWGLMDRGSALSEGPRAT